MVLEYQGEREKFDFCWGDQNVIPPEAIEYFCGSFKGHNFSKENLSLKKSEDNRSIIAHDGVNAGTMALDEEGGVKFTATFPAYSDNIWGDPSYRWENTHLYYRLENGAINLYHSTAPPPLNGIYLTEKLDGLPVLKGDKVLIALFGGAILFTVTGITPNEANLSGNQTLIVQI